MQKDRGACGALTPVHAVPAKAQASGSRYQGETAIRYTLSDTLATVVATAPHALQGFSWNTCCRRTVSLSLARCSA